MGTVAVFIDAGYLEKLLSNEFPDSRVSYEKVAQEAAGTHELLRTYYYNCPIYQSSPPTLEERKRCSDQQKFFYALEKLPRFEVRLGKLARRIDQNGKVYYEQKRVDILMAVDLVLLAVKNRISHATIITGDSDLIPAVTIARNEGVVVHLFHGRQCHNDLWSACDDRTLIDQAFVDAVLLSP